MSVQFKFDGSITLIVPYDQLPDGLLGQDAEAIRQWAAAWWRENVSSNVRVELERVSLPRFREEK